MSRVAIIGAGPAGVSASLYVVRAGVETICFTTKNSALKKTEAIENYYGFSEPITGQALEENGVQGAKRLGVQFIEEEVVGLSYENGFLVETTKGSYEAEAVILATGSGRLVPPLRQLEAWEGHGVSYCAVCDGFFYRRKKVGVLGSGEYALHEARALSMAAEVTIFTNGEDTTADFSPEFVVDPRKIVALDGEDRLEKVIFDNGEERALDGLFIAYGVAGSVSLAKKIGALTEGKTIAIDEHMATNVPGLYAAGDCTGGLLQIAKAVYEGAKAGLEVVKFLRR